MALAFGPSREFPDVSAGFSVAAKLFSLLRGLNRVGYGCTSQGSSSEKPIDLQMQ